VYATALASTVLATANEAFVVAAAATEARVLVVRPHGTETVEPVYARTLRRELLAERQGRSLDPLHVVTAAEDAQMVRKGSTREVVSLPVDVVSLPVDADSPAGPILTAWSRTYDSQPQAEPCEPADG
jgi:hypothetical protein